MPDAGQWLARLHLVDLFSARGWVIVMLARRRSMVDDRPSSSARSLSPLLARPEIPRLPRLLLEQRQSRTGGTQPLGARCRRPDGMVCLDCLVCLVCPSQVSVRVGLSWCGWAGLESTLSVLGGQSARVPHLRLRLLPAVKASRAHRRAPAH